MFCTQCGRDRSPHAKYCENCGAENQSVTRNAIDAEPSDASAIFAGTKFNTDGVSQVRPWVRYWARACDIYLYVFTTGFVISFIFPEALEHSNYVSFAGVFIVFTWVFVESLLLSTIGTTPGKSLFRIRIIPRQKPLLDYATAFSRSVKVWIRGLGIGLPLVSLITLIVAHIKLTRNGITSWDREGQKHFIIVHEKIGFVRVALFLSFLAVMIYLGNRPK